MRIALGGSEPVPFRAGYQHEVFWPALNAGPPGGAWPTVGVDRAGIDPTTQTIWALSGAGASTLQLNGNRVYGRLTNTRLADMVAPLAHANLAILPANYRLPEQRRVFWWSFTMLLSANPATWGFLSGVILRNNQTATGWFSADAGNVIGQGCGIVGDAAGGWRWVTKENGALGPMNETVPLAWPRALNQPVEVWFVIHGATATRAARYRLYLDRALVLERSWGAGGTGTGLPGYDSGVATAFRLMAQSGHAGLQLDITDMAFRAGVYDVDGAELNGL